MSVEKHRKTIGWKTDRGKTGDKEVYKALNADKRKRDHALGLLRLHHMPLSKPLEILREHSASVTHSSVNKASSKCQARYAGMKDPLLLFPALRMCFHVYWGGGGGGGGGGIGGHGCGGRMQLYRIMLHFIGNNKVVHS